MAIAVVGVLAGCTDGSVGVGRQAPTTETRAVGLFESIAVANSIIVHARVGPNHSLSVTAEPSVMSHVVTSVSDRRLTIAMDRSAQEIRAVNVELTAPSLSEIDATTAASVVVEGLTGDSLNVSADSTASVTMTGSIGRLVLVAASGATLKLVGMPVRTAQVDIGTSSQVEIAAVETVRGSVHESASLTVSGESATVDVTESTSGRVIRTS
jgi:hypothetical protein